MVEMTKGQEATLRALLAIAVSAATGGVVALAGLGLIASAQAQSWEEKKKQQQQQQQRAAPPQQQPRPTIQQQPTFQQQPRPAQPAPRFTQPPPSREPLQRQLPPPQRPVQQFQDKPLQDKSFQGKPLQRELPPSRPTQQFQPPPGQKQFQPKPFATPGPQPELKQDSIKRFPGQPGQQALPPPREPRPLTVTPGQGPTLRRFEDVKKFRLERVEDGGRRKVIEEPGRRFIVKERNKTIVRHDETDRFLRRPGAQTLRRSDGTVETFYIGRNGVRIYTVVDANGRLLRRYRRDRDGRERNIIDNRRFWRNVAIGLGLGIVALNLPPPRVTIPYEDYIVDYDSASDDDLYETLDAPPVEDLDRAYSLEEIRDNYELLARVRSIDIDSIEFESGSWEVTPEQYPKLERIARAILRLLDRNPESVIMIAGHTDAVGPEDENASLADRRATAVAEVLTEQFEVPPENLVTQGYGEQHLKIDTQGPEPRNRRVSIHNVTRLMAER
jgi:outer membrane protein OmpA-like peptidoglycan-associated protein